MNRKRTAVLISGSGTNLQALIDAANEKHFPAEIVLVISNKADAYGLERAQKAGIATRVINHRDFPARELFDSALHAALLQANIEIVCLAGFMRVLSDEFVQKWEGRLINIHPSLLPAFPGLHTHRRVLEEGAQFTGCTVHFVVPEVDAGPIIKQATVEVKPGDTEETLAARVLAVEHRIYPESLKLLAEGKLAVENGRVKIAG